MIDYYFKKALLYDYMLGVIICSVFYALFVRDYIDLPKAEDSKSLTTDLATISLTLAGFVLTLLTVLVTFKTGAKIPNNQNDENVPLFDMFFSTRLYYDTTNLLKGCIKSLIFIAVLGFTLKLLLSDKWIQYIFFSNILGLIIIFTTLWRSLLILSSIINLQKEQ